LIEHASLDTSSSSASSGLDELAVRRRLTHNLSQTRTHTRSSDLGHSSRSLLGGSSS